MSVQAEWNGFVWGVTPDRARPIASFSSTLSTSVERNEDKEGEPATQTVARDLITIDLEYEVVRAAGGLAPKEEYKGWTLWVGTYAPFFLGGEKYLADLYLLTEATPSDVIMAADGEWQAAKISLHFEQYAEDESGLKLDSITQDGLIPGVMEQTVTSAVSVGPSETQKAGKMPANTGM